MLKPPPGSVTRSSLSNDSSVDSLIGILQTRAVAYRPAGIFVRFLLVFGSDAVEDEGRLRRVRRNCDFDNLTSEGELTQSLAQNRMPEAN